MLIKKILSYIGFPYIIYKTYSDYNGEINVYLLFGRKSISVDNLTQSGPIVESLWKEALGRLKVYDLTVRNILVLGVGGGSVVKVLRAKYADTDIVGVEIDKKMVDIGKQFFELGKYKAKIIIADAFSFVQKNQSKYDLICIDLLVGRVMPKKFSSLFFFKNIKNILKQDGVVIINQLRLKSKKNKEISCNLVDVLSKIFNKVEVKKPLINTLIFCR